jgi:hypothetical protein
MAVKRKVVSLEDELDSANKHWDRVLKLTESGVVDKGYILAAMNMLDLVHLRAMRENKSHLLREK